MKDLIKITTNEKGQQLVSARELHEFLEVKSKYADWIKNRIRKYDFIEFEDFITVSKILENGGKEYDHALTIDMAKELSMVENNDKGKQARKYFIECEKITKGETNFTKYITEVDIAKAEISLMGEVAKILNLNESSKLIGITNIYKEHGISTAALPVYTNSKGVLKSATELLKSNNINISTRAFNKIMISKGFLQIKTRKSSKGIEKKFNNLVNLEFGENQISPKNPKETQPMYYEDKFEELLKELGI